MEMECSRAYNWISSLPPNSESNALLTSSFAFFPKVELNVNREGLNRRYPHATVDLNFTLGAKSKRFTLGNFIELQPKVIASLLFQVLHDFICLMLSNFEKNGFDREYNDRPVGLIVSEVDSQVTEKPSYPLVFDSLLLCICCLVKPEYSKPFANKMYRQLTSTDVLLAIGPQFQTLYLHFLQFLLLPWSDMDIVNVVSTSKFWNIGVQGPTSRCPVEVPEKLLPTMLSQQFNCTIQLAHQVDIKNNFIEVQVRNIICDVLPFKILPKQEKEHYIWTEKYFPSKMVISVVPQCQRNEMIISLDQSTDNPTVQTSTGQSFEMAFQTPKEVGLKKSSTTSSTQTLTYWKSLQTAEGSNGSFEWILYDPLSGVEVISSKPRKKSFFKSDQNTWYKDRYKKACSPFNHKGGVVFAADKYGRTLTWTMNRNIEEGESLKLKVEGSIWLTYWPNFYNTSFYNTVKHDFCKEVELQLKT